MTQAKRALGVLVLLLMLAPRSGGGAANAPVAVCTLTHPAYAGACVVREPLPEGKTPAVVCGQVLKCLNDTNCAVTHCNATEIRGGWALESAKEESKSESK